MASKLEAEKVLQMLFAFYCKSRGILQNSSYLKDKKHIISGIETVVNRPTWIPSKNHPFTANIDAAVQNYRANPGKKLAGTGLVVVDQAYYPLCCGTSWASIDRKGDVVDNLELDVKAVCRWAKLVTDRYGLKDFHIQVDTLHIPRNLVQNKVLMDTPIDKTLKKIRDELIVGKGFSVELEWISRHCNAVANSFAAMGCDIQFAKEGGANLAGFLHKKEFYGMKYPKWKEEGFSEFFDEETYRIWDKDTGFPEGFQDILLRTFRNRVIIPSDIHGMPTSFEIPQFNIVDPIGKQFLDLIDVIAELISREEISSILAQFCCEGEDIPKEEYLIDVNYIKKARKPPNDLFNFLESIQVHSTQTGLPFKKGVLKVFVQYRKGSNKTNTVLKKSIPDPIIEFHRRWKYFGSFCFQITMSTNFEESDEDRDRFEAYQDSISKLRRVSYDGYKPHLRASGERNENFYALLGTIPVEGDLDSGTSCN